MSEALREQVATVEQWYHTLELAPGVVTPGFFDLRGVSPKLPWPDLSGKRCLDIGTFDGFWAYEMERRGAREVVAIDVLKPDEWDWPRGSTEQLRETMDKRKRGGVGFEIAHAALGSSVRRVERSVYDLAEDELGRFDFVYLGSLLLHLRDPVRALERAAEVCDGELMMMDAYDPKLDFRMRRRPAANLDAVGRPWWWKPNVAGLVRMAEVAGLEVLSGPHRFHLPYGPGFPRPIVTPRRLLTRARSEAVRAALLGDPHAALLTRPR